MKTVVNGDFAKLLDTSTAVGTFFLALPAAVLVINSNVSVFKERVFDHALISLTLGSPGFPLVLRAFSSPR